MSSIKNFKSRVSANRSRSNSNSKISKKSINESQFQNSDLQKLQMNFDKIIQFKLNLEVFKSHQQIKTALKMYNKTGARLWISIKSSNQSYFHIEPKKQILQNNQPLQIVIRLLAKPAIQFQEYENQNFQLKWGRISTQQLQNRQIPLLTNKKILGCRITNKQSLNQFLASTGYNQRQQNNNDFLKVRRIYRQNENSRQFDNGIRQNYSKSGINNEEPHFLKQNHQSLLTRNNIIIVAVVSFLIGFITA